MLLFFFSGIEWKVRSFTVEIGELEWYVLRELRDLGGEMV
jgi:hypothetical protein